MTTAFAFDLDGTLTTEELLPIVARSLGIEKEIATLTDLTIRGLIGFEDSFRLRFAILKHADVKLVQDAVANVRIDPHLIRFIAERPDNCFVITGNLEIWIAPLAKRLGCKIFCSTASLQDGRLHELSDVMHKGAPVVELRQRFSRIVAIGEGANDIPMFDAADIGVAFGGIHAPAPGLAEIADYITYDSEGLCRLLSTL